MVRDIRARYDRNTPHHASALAEEHGISKDSVFGIMRGSHVWPLEPDHAPLPPGRDERYVVVVCNGYEIRPGATGGGRKTSPVEANVLDRCYSHRRVHTERSGPWSREQAIDRARAVAHRLNLEERRWEDTA